MSITAQDLRNAIQEAFDGRNLFALPLERLGIFEQPDSRHRHLYSGRPLDLTSADPLRLEITGRTVLFEDGAAMPVRVRFTEDHDGRVSTVTLETLEMPDEPGDREPPPTVRHPALDEALRALPGLGPYRATRLTAFYDIPRQANTLSYGFVADLTGPTQGCQARATVRCEEESGHPERVTATAHITLPGQGPELAFSFAEFAGWAGADTACLGGSLDAFRVRSVAFGHASHPDAFTFTLSGELALFGVSGTARVEIRSVAASDDTARTISVSGTLSVPVQAGEGPRDLVLGLTYAHGETDTLTISGRFADAPAFDGLDGVACLPFVPSEPRLMAELPEGLADIVRHVSVNGLSACFDLSTMSLAGIGLDIAVKGAWELIPGLLTLEEVDLWFLLGFGKGARRSQGGLTARGLLADGLEAVASATFPDPVIRLTVEAHMLRDRDIGDFGPPRLDGGGVRLREAQAEYAVRDGSYLAAFALESEIHIPDPRPGRGRSPITLTGAELRLSGRSGEPVQVLVAARMDIGSAHAEVSARHDRDRWILDARLTHADFGELGGWLREEFGITPPQALAGLRLDRAELSYELGPERRLSLACDGSVRLFGHEAVFSTTVDLADAEASFDGTLRIDLDSPEGEPHPMELDTRFHKENGAWEIQAAWRDPAGIPLSWLLPDVLDSAILSTNRTRVDSVALTYDAALGSCVLALEAGGFSLVAVDRRATDQTP
ncbi:hypothetical protein ABZ667_40670 [Streptomyces lavendulae]|uniref:hypothetical protein n=1 Tax=Streptomyces lavendulae TaxID=1914 RepID=UPI00340FB48B